MNFQVISDEEWERLPRPAPGKKESQWKDALNLLAQGKAIAIPYSSDKELRGIRIGLARTAAAQQMKLEFRPHSGQLAVKKSGEPYAPKQPRTGEGQETGTKRTRRGRGQGQTGGPEG